jgi:anti-sigma factor RsiW
MTARRAQGEVSNEVLVRYLQGEMTRSESEETERLIADSRRAQVRLAELREMTETLRRPPDWVASADLTAAVASRVRQLEPSAERRRPRRALWLSAGAAAAAAAAVILLVAAPWRPDGRAPEEPRA